MGLGQWERKAHGCLQDNNPKSSKDCADIQDKSTKGAIAWFCLLQECKSIATTWFVPQIFSRPVLSRCVFCFALPVLTIRLLHVSSLNYDWYGIHSSARFCYWSDCSAPRPWAGKDHARMQTDQRAWSCDVCTPQGGEPGRRDGDRDKINLDQSTFVA